MKIKNGDKNTFNWIVENIFSENIFSKKSKIENNKKSRFQYF